MILLAFIYIAFDPRFDTVVVGGKKRRILWYDGRDGRNWVFL